MPEKKSERPEGQMRRRPMRRRKKVCAFCADANKALDYKDVALLKKSTSFSSYITCNVLVSLIDNLLNIPIWHLCKNISKFICNI